MHSEHTQDCSDRQWEDRGQAGQRGYYQACHTGMGNAEENHLAKVVVSSAQSSVMSHQSRGAWKKEMVVVSVNNLKIKANASAAQPEGASKKCRRGNRSTSFRPFHSIAETAAGSAKATARQTLLSCKAC